MFERRELGGGLSTYGIITLREPVEVALTEVDMILDMGVEFKTGVEFGQNSKLSELQANFAAVFLGVGLGSTPTMGIGGEEHVIDGLQYIEQSKLDRPRLSIGRKVIVIGAGNTAIDCATIAKRLGAERVTIVYRRSEREMSAYDHEYEFIKKEGVEFRFQTQPTRVIVENGCVTSIECVRMALAEPDTSGRASPQVVAGSEFILPADQVVKAIGQEKPSVGGVLDLSMEKGKIKVNREFETNIQGVYAGGDCIRAQGACSTVMAVQDGKLAAQSIHRRLMETLAHGARSGGNGRSQN
jgi:dihydropyrimidine dehydrogenase (NAD+) subunit PreT